MLSILLRNLRFTRTNGWRCRFFENDKAKVRTGFGASLGVRTCELFFCFVATVRVRAVALTSLFSLFYVTGEFHRFLHRGRARICTIDHSLDVQELTESN